ncbi:hypothetical protein [Bradyrhizobium diazoefficiens]|uniref:hypothetical protein n=1 Tax=Bradyrhizobium diazoefficiens TaxID=1355477 RepID=UPI001FED761B|nr:hypothetical protein [Bradyrhizobium diazoefficiens]
MPAWQALTEAGKPNVAAASNPEAVPALWAAMKLVRDEAASGGERYVCPDCDDDPLHDPAAWKWVDGPLGPPAK